MIRRIFFTLSLVLGLSGFAKQSLGASDPKPIRPGFKDWPVAWVSYSRNTTLEEDIKDLKGHGVGLINARARNASEAAKMLETCRRTGMKLNIDLPEVTQSGDLVKSVGLEPAPALMIGGVYQGLAIDRHLFSFSAGPQKIVIEPPVYSRTLPYTRGSGGTGPMKKGEPVGHYFPDIPDPVRAEIIVPLANFDGKQHLKIIPAKVVRAPADSKLEKDSVTPDMPPVSETKNRKLFTLQFDLTGLVGARLDAVGVAVYWPYDGSRQYWMFGGRVVSALAPSTRQAMAALTRKALEPWRAANGGAFPIDTVLAARFGDECFYTTSHLNGPAVNYPLWDYSAPAIERFHAQAGAIEYPRTWGFPEVYGPDAYGWWLYGLHQACAELTGVVHDEIAKLAPGLLLYRNTTRAGVFALPNDHDGSGQELLTRALDVVHLDPYPVDAAGYGNNIPRDMNYCAGLARRYGKLLIPWMQAHTYGGPTGLQHPSPGQVDRMAAEQWRQGVDAVVWLGYGGNHTFPKTNPASWERAAAFHQKLEATPPPKPHARVAVLRGYKAWALSSEWEGKIRNPADWRLQQWLEVWAVKHGMPYDVFELPPSLNAEERAKMERDLKNYDWVVTTEPRAGAWVIEGGAGEVVDKNQGKAVQQQFENEINKRGWLKE